MDEETKVPETEVAEPEKTEEVVEQAEPTEVEKLAQKLGWNPNHSGPDTVGPDEFILRTSQIKDRLTRQTRNLQREMSALREGVDAIKWSGEQQRKKEVRTLKAEIAELKAARKKAIDDQDHTQIDALDSRIDAVKDNIREAEKPPEPPKTEKSNPVFDEWVENNQWFYTDPEMRAYADAIANLNPKTPLPQLLKMVDDSVKKRFSDKLSPPETKHEPAKAAVASSKQRPAGAKKKATADDLSFEQRQIGLEFVTKKVFKDLDEYAQSLKEMSGGK